MRYWIFWNNLVQGPFEVDELVKLHAFTGDLLVCEETQQDWAPVAQVGNFTPYLKSPTVDVPPPRPAPPSGPFLHDPLQGEFVTDETEQKNLFGLNGSGPYVYRSIHSDGALPKENVLPPAITAPFHFGVVPPPVEIDRVPVESELDIPSDVEEERREPEESDALAINKESAEAMQGNHTRPLALEILPAPEIAKESLDHEIEKTLDALEENSTPESISLIEPASFSTLGPIEPMPSAEAIAEAIPSAIPSMMNETPQIRIHWWPWVIGGFVFLLLMSGGMYWLIDHWSTRSAIEEAIPSQGRSSLPVAPVKTSLPSVVSRKTEEKPTFRTIKPTAIPVTKKETFKTGKEKRHSPASPRHSIVAAGHTSAASEGVKRKTPVAKTSKVISALSPKPSLAPSTSHHNASEHATGVVSKTAHAEHPLAPPKISSPLMVPGMLITGAQGGWVKAQTSAAQGPGKSSNPWTGLEQQALEMALQHKIYGGKRTIGSNARLMLEDMHEKELLHAAQTGERLYLPDKLSTAALYEEGPLYRVYLNFMAWQPSGERVEARSYQVHVNFEKKLVDPLDSVTHHDFFDPSAMLIHVHNSKADDIESILSAVDALNKITVDSIIMKKSHASKKDRRQTENALHIAQDKLTRTLAYFRTKYPEQELKNVAKAYDFLEILKGH